MIYIYIYIYWFFLPESIGYTKNVSAFSREAFMYIINFIV